MAYQDQSLGEERKGAEGLRGREIWERLCLTLCRGLSLSLLLSASGSHKSLTLWRREASWRRLCLGEWRAWACSLTPGKAHYRYRLLEAQGKALIERVLSAGLGWRSLPLSPGRVG